jgi:DNA-binding MarR family transcriptional regulator
VHKTARVSPAPSAWDLTRAIAPRRYVNRMIAEADGTIRSNSYPSKFPTAGYTPPSTPWTIDLTDHDGRFWFAAFDLDAKTPEDFDQAAEDLGVLVRILRDAALPHVVCRSSPTGGFHVWVPLAGVDKATMVQLAAAAKAVLPSLDHGLLCNDRTGAVRPPLTPHARGGASEVMAGADDVTVLRTPTVTAGDLLRVTAAFREIRPTADPADSSPTGPIDARHHAHRALPAWGEAHMATVAGGRDPSRTGYLCLLAAAVSGWTLTDVDHAARTAPGMEHYRTRNRPTGGREPRQRAEAAARLERQWAKAQDRAVLYRYAPEERAQRDLTELAGIVDVVEAMLQAFTASPGRWTRTEADLHDSTVLTYLAWLSLRSGARDVAAALRSVAIATGIPSSTVDRSFRRLHAAGWIIRRRRPDGTNAAVWRLTERFSTPSVHVGPLHDVTARPPAELFDVRVTLLDALEDRLDAGRHDVFTRAGLGPTARRTYESLTTAENAHEAVAARAGLPHGRTRVALARLRRHALAIASRSGWRRRLHDFRTHVAKQLGVDGILQRREQQYVDERDLWAWWQSHLIRKLGRRGRDRVPTTQVVMFRAQDDRGGPEAYPAYPCTSDGRADHQAAMRFVRRRILQELRDLELAA